MIEIKDALSTAQAAKLITKLSGKKMTERNLRYHIKMQNVPAVLIAGTYFIETKDAREFALNRPAAGRPTLKRYKPKS